MSDTKRRKKDKDGDKAKAKTKKPSSRSKDKKPKDPSDEEPILADDGDEQLIVADDDEFLIADGGDDLLLADGDGDIMDEDEEKPNYTKPKPKDYRCLHPDDLVKAQNAVIEQTVELAGLPGPICRMLLVHFKWVTILIRARIPTNSCRMQKLSKRVILKTLIHCSKSWV